MEKEPKKNFLNSVSLLISLIELCLSEWMIVLNCLQFYNGINEM